MNVLVLGCGLVGRPMAVDLAKEKLFNVTVADLNKQNLDKISNDLPIKKIVRDISDPNAIKNITK